MHPPRSFPAGTACHRAGTAGSPYIGPHRGQPPIEPRAVLSRSGTVPSRSFGGWVYGGPHPRELRDLTDQSTRRDDIGVWGAISWPPIQSEHVGLVLLQHG